MTLIEYAPLARRTQQPFGKTEKLLHGMCGLASEINELDEAILLKKDIVDEAGDVMWFLVEIADALGFEYNDLMERTVLEYAIDEAKDALSDGYILHWQNFAQHTYAQLANQVQKSMQGHKLDEGYAKMLVACTIGIITVVVADSTLDNTDNALSVILSANIEKLKKRYPDGFDEERSVNREKYEGEDHEIV